ncbi:hypothetical protein UFOVP188_26 [uncultured Caudovirales phage]|uniref:Uncharacterized protein n=1 Tax=uncultured Caudovirales phage TaxID=2100421 RepID=A0A6J7WIC2_9CAUD|nr:hypothetical protein UFOVP188_26 [uncultured Caudovirales phage]
MTQEALKLALEWFKCYADHSMSRNNAEALADEVVEAIEKALAKEKALQALHNENERLGLYKDAYAQPEQEPVAYFNPQVKGGFYWAKPTKITAPVTVSVEPMPLYTTPPLLEERNFCPRCGKRNKDIHTCTPPQD